MRVSRGRVRLLEPWVPLHRVSVLVYLWRVAGRFRRLVGTNRWSIFLVRHDPSTPGVASASLPSLEEAIAEADGRAEVLRGGGL